MPKYSQKHPFLILIFTCFTTHLPEDYDYSWEDYDGHVGKTVVMTKYEEVVIKFPPLTNPTKTSRR